MPFAGLDSDLHFLVCDSLTEVVLHPKQATLKCNIHLKILDF